ncbi:hypothetical protein CRG98_012221 [Punica granatum]|uniref:Uncharacterized protein n=1 Tax=Punica granatum TaxID=22663 RepID=A0A2I0KFV1_PUNGR|nr:hypothetical protein CRG98_012221 [Punica granatum]
MTNGTSERTSEASCLSRGTPEPSQTSFLTGLPGTRSTGEETAPRNLSAHTQGPPGPWNKFQIAFRGSSWAPDRKTIRSREPPPGASNFLDVPFLSTTLASRAITFKGFLITLTLPYEEVVTVREPLHRAQPPFHPSSLYQESKEPNLAPCRGRSRRADLTFSMLPLPLFSSVRRPSRPTESSDSQGHFPDSFLTS